MEIAIADRLKSKESVFLNHSVKKACVKVVGALKASGDKDKAATKAAAKAAVRELDLYTLEIDKAELVARSCAQQLADYAGLEAQVKALVESTTGDITRLSADLKEAKKARMHKEQYEALAKLVNRHASKPTTRAEQAALEEELEKLKGEAGRLEEQVTVRSKQFALLMATISDLTATLEEDPFNEQDPAAERGEDGAAPRRGRGEEDEDGEMEDEDDAAASKRAKTA